VARDSSRTWTSAWITACVPLTCSLEDSGLSDMGHSGPGRANPAEDIHHVGYFWTVMLGDRRRSRDWPTDSGH
jgi:hypothetical protein